MIIIIFLIIISSLWLLHLHDRLFLVIISFPWSSLSMIILSSYLSDFYIVASSWSSRPHDSLIVLIISSSWSSYRRDICVIIMMIISSSSSHYYEHLIPIISLSWSFHPHNYVIFMIILAWSFYLLDQLIFTIISTSWSSHSQAHFLLINSSSMFWSSHPRWSSCFHDHRILMIITSSGSLILICNVKRMLTSTFYILFKLILLAKLLILFYVFYACSFPTCRKFLSFFKDITS